MGAREKTFVSCVSCKSMFVFIAFYEPMIDMDQQDVQDGRKTFLSIPRGEQSSGVDWKLRGTVLSGGTTGRSLLYGRAYRTIGYADSQ